VNKWLAIAGSVAGVISAGVLMMGMSSVSGHAHFVGCTEQVAHGASTVSTRVLQWQGGDAVDIRIPGAVHFTVAPEWRAIAKGPSEVLEKLHMENGEIEFDPSFNYCGDELQIELQGPAVSSWSLHSSGDLVLQGLSQDTLDVYLSGSGSVRASGHVRTTRANIKGSGDVNLDELVQQQIELDIHGSGSATARGVADQTRIAIYGSGDANFGKLIVKSASVRIHGSGDVFIAPSETVEAQIFGSGDVHLLSKPKQVQQRVFGSGEVSEVRS
jgi:hypothetical protein